MGISAINSFDLGELSAGTGVEVVLVTPASVRLVADGVGATALTNPENIAFEATLKPRRKLTVPSAGRWRLLVEHANGNRHGGCNIQILSQSKQSA